MNKDRKRLGQELEKRNKKFKLGTNFQPRVIYRTPREKRENSVLKYIGHRILRNTENKNFLCAVVGTGGMGKSWGCLGIAEVYSKMFGVHFDPEVHVISSLKEMLQLLTTTDLKKKVATGTPIVFDEPQIEANARAWQSEMNQALNQLITTFRNQRLFVLFAVPFLDMIDKQTRIMFHGEFKVLGFDSKTGFTHFKPRFLEYVSDFSKFYKKRLIVEYVVENKRARNRYKLQNWDVPRASKETIDIYERKKKEFTTNLNLKLLRKIELTEKIIESKDKSGDLIRVRELFHEYGEDYFKILEKMPHLVPFTLEKYLYFVKRADKLAKNQGKHDIGQKKE